MTDNVTEGEVTVDTVTVTIPPVNTEPKPSDPDRRISNLQSQLDKQKAEIVTIRSERDKAIRERAEAQQQLNNITTNHTVALDEASRTTQSALDREKSLTDENATLRAKIAKLNLLVSNPDIAPWADLLPETEDATVLATKADTIRRARDGDRTNIVTQLKTGTVPSVNPARAGTKMNPAEIQKYLKEAQGNPKLFEERMAELKASGSWGT